MKQLFLLATLCVMAYSSFAQISKEYETDVFSSIDISDGFRVHLTPADQHNVTVESPSDLVDKIMIEVQHGTLMISHKNDKWYKGWNSDASKIDVHISCPELTEVNVSGSSKLTMSKTIELDDLSLKISGASAVDFKATCDDLRITVDGASSLNMDIAADNIAVKASGASQMNLSGKADEMSISSSGASNIKASELMVEEIVIASGDASNIDLWLTGNLTVAASGGSNIQYKCDDCDDVNVKTTGGASVKKY
ncbi:MAG: DUF2807 domain-containing protein [Bacteroidetes bacterium]|nr:DUF2807 domain-containing protein [Bacteroidota bacterium]